MYHSANTWPNWWESGDMTVRRLDSVPSLTPSSMPFYFFPLSHPCPPKGLPGVADSSSPDLTFP